MRILTGHDYYDTALVWGRDNQIVFLRHKEKLIPHRSTPFEVKTFREKYVSLHPSVTIEGSRWNSSSFSTRTTNYTVEPITVYFCGKRYNGVKVKSRDHITYTTSELHFWDFTSFINWLASKNVKADMKYDPERSFEKYFDTQISKKEFEYLIENKYTIVVSQWDFNDYCVKDRSWKIDSPDLKTIQFYKVFDAYSAFQEISMWVGGVLTGQGRPMVEISDKYKIHKHGFDKWSFRTMPKGK